MLARMGAGLGRLGAVACVLLGLTACSGLSDTEQRALTGGAIGAAGGAVLGAIAGSPAIGAAVGGGLGAAAGALMRKDLLD